MLDELRLQRRRAMTDKFVSGEWAEEFKGFDEAQKAERKEAKRLAELWEE